MFNKVFQISYVSLALENGLMSVGNWKKLLVGLSEVCVSLLSVT